MKDRFSSHARQYAAFRPTYPVQLYDFIFKQVKHFDTAWDAGTGNGQVARELPRYLVIGPEIHHGERRQSGGGVY